MVGVGAVYFLDRLWDHQRSRVQRSGIFPDFTLGTSLVPAAGACGLAAVIPWNSGSVPAERLAGFIAICFLATISYYGVRRSFPHWQRGRALAVSLIFCAGTAGPAAAWSGKAPDASHIAFLLLLWLNATICLNPGRLLNRTGQVALLAASVFFLAATKNPGIQLAGGMAAAALGILVAIQRPSNHKLRAAFADMALWIPALLAAVLR